MTDRHAGYLVTLAKDVREDDAEAIVTALKMVKGVLTVEPITSDGEIRIGYQRARREISTKIFELLREADLLT